MPTQRTAQQLVDLTRQYVGVFDNTRLRDGFASDEGEADQQILTPLNAYYRSLIPTGFAQCTFTQPLLVGSGAYSMDADIGTILGVTYFDSVASGVALTNTELTSLDAPDRQTAWRTAPNSQPREWYMKTPRLLGLFPPPLTAGAYVQILAESTPADLVLPSDVPIDLFTGYHDELCYGAAAAVLNILATTEIEIARRDFCVGKAKRLEDWVQELAQSRAQVARRQIVPFTRRRGRGR